MLRVRAATSESLHDCQAKQPQAALIRPGVTAVYTTFEN